jgi:hypothetical protein
MTDVGGAWFRTVSFFADIPNLGLAATLNVAFGAIIFHLMKNVVVI